MIRHPTFLSATIDMWRAERGGPSALTTRQHRRLLDLVGFARKHSPWYQHLYHQLPPDINDLRLLPPVTKPELMAQFDDWLTDPAVTRSGVDAFIADKSLVGLLYLGRYFVCITSGTTGTPGIFLHDSDDLKIATALGTRVERAWVTPGLMWHMLCRGGRTAAVVATGDHFLGYASIERLHKLYPWLRAYAKRARAFSVTQPLPHLVQELNAFQPARMMSYPTALALLAEEQMAGRLRIQPVLLIAAGEWLAPAVRERIASAFHCLVQASYSASECQSIAFDCGHGWLHVHSDWVILEPVDTDYQPVPTGQPSRTVLLTNLTNYVQPIIRYDLGDSITVNPDPCPCGSPLPAIRVEGRKDEILYLQTPGGEAIPVLPMAIATVVEETPGVHRFQIIQTAPATLHIRLEIVPGGDEVQTWTMVTSRLREYLSAQGLPSVSLEQDSERPQPHPISGKFRHVWAEKESLLTNR